MFRLRSITILAVLVLAALPFGRAQAERTLPPSLPMSAQVEIVLVKAPGLDDEASNWEVSYEFRLANEITLWQKRNDLKAGSQQRVGELIKEGGAKGLLRSPANRRFVFTIPFSSEVQAKLRNQPRERVKMTGAEMSPDQVKQLKDQEHNSQVFLFYPIINIYDGRLKKSFLISTSRIWDYESYPEARFKIKIEINGEGNYKVDSSLPTKP